MMMTSSGRLLIKTYGTSTVQVRVRVATPSPPPNIPSFDQLRTAARHSQKRMFMLESCTIGTSYYLYHRPVLHPSMNFSPGGDDDSETDLKSQDDEHPDDEKDAPALGEAWFDKPKYMPDWLYQYFQSHPAFDKPEEGPPGPPRLYTGELPSFWIHPPEPTFLLSQYTFNPYLMDLLFAH
ncbi:hypothetical protein DFH09DRAFT_1080244 [Mycena vulgaris]|nr:hypothetical protein DFH09DRAFT_1080244 [Mycena vulgaris]